MGAATATRVGEKRRGKKRISSIRESSRPDNDMYESGYALKSSRACIAGR